VGNRHKDIGRLDTKDWDPRALAHGGIVMAPAFQ